MFTQLTLGKLSLLEMLSSRSRACIQITAEVN